MRKQFSLAAFCALMTAVPASAEVWDQAEVMGKTIVTYTPTTFEHAAETPTVLVFNDDERSSLDLATRLPIWHYAQSEGFKVIYAGGLTAATEDTGAIIPAAIELALRSAGADPSNIYTVAYGASAGLAFEFACKAPGMMRGIIAIDYEGPDRPGSFSCKSATDLNVLTVHDGKPGRSPAARDTSAVDATMDTLTSAGAKVQSYPVPGDDAAFPGIEAKFHQRSGIPLEKLTSLFIGKTLGK